LSATLTVPVAAQKQKIDSLKSILETKSGIVRAHVLFELAYQYADNDNSAAMTYITQGTKLAEASGDSLMIVKCGRLKSLLHRRFDQMDSSLSISERLLPIAERNNYTEEVKKLLNGLGLVYSFKAMYDKALSAYLRMLDATDPEKNTREFSTALNNVGLVYFKLDDLDKALYYFNRSLAVKYESNDKVDLETTLLNVGLCYAYKKDFSLAREYTDQVLGSCKSQCSPFLMCSAYFNLGLIDFSLNRLPQAENYFLRSYAHAKEITNEPYQFDNLIHLFQIYSKTGNTEAAKKLIKDAEAILSTETYYTQGIMELYGELSKVYQLLGDLGQVVHYQSKYIQLKDNVFTEDLTKNLMKVEAQYLERENNAKIQAQAKILELSNDIISRQKALNIGVCIVAILSIAIVVVLMQNVKQKRLANYLLEEKVKQRTIELEANRTELLKSLEERNQQMKRLSTEVKSSMATIKGLCQLSVKDFGMLSNGQYIDRIERATDNLQAGIYRTLGMNESGVV
jgi:tetratricopeptide (TPR) repeat protein